MYKPPTNKLLWAFISDQFKLKLPHRVFTPGHSTPFAFVADAFFHPGKDLAAWANRSGLKTLCSSIIAALEFLYSDKTLKGRVLAGSEDQAKNLYEYWENWCFKVLAGRIKGEPGRLVTRLDNGTFQILAASQKRVRGAKVQRLFRDEIDEIDPDVMSASVGMLAELDGVPSRTIDTSTWHNPQGPMGRLVEEADKRGITLHKWNVWESIAQCPTERHENGRGCTQCPLGVVCLGKAGEYRRGGGQVAKGVGIASECCGIFAIDDAIKQFRQWSEQQWAAEAECKRPSLTGLVYPQFDRLVHVMPGLDFSDDLPTYRAIDFGLNDFVCLWIQEDKKGAVYVVDEYWAENATVAQNAREINKRDEGVTVYATFVDPAGRNRNDQTGHSAIDELKGHGIKCDYTLSPWGREVKNGINMIRGYLMPGSGKARLFVAGACKRLIAAFESYKLRKVNNEYIDEPIKPQACDHPMDALRYWFVNQHAIGHSGSGYLSYT